MIVSYGTRVYIQITIKLAYVLSVCLHRNKSYKMYIENVKTVPSLDGITFSPCFSLFYTFSTKKMHFFHNHVL